ncbi:glycosyltransferase family 2 protein [Paraburkholderia sp. Tr-20389]|uniref:glycosyltransferase family 2 protein n=1 Tax=Paraburkholderia sp. Tr-20389 TaxID=2703903 RepID=UPI00197F2003|nr:glycosyltransferase family 2 protein [Paraburkholderia sp. Tr-20389]
MRISIAMATYNGARYIRQQLDSLADQTVLPFELVVTDDGSTDDTLAIIERFAEHAPFEVRIFRNPQRLNFADNFLRAASLCRGDWIAFCDQDDVWMKDKLECVKGAAHGDVSMIVHRVKSVDADLRPISGRGIECRVRRGSGPQRLPPFGFFSGLCITFDAALLPLLTQSPRFPDAYDQRYEAAHDRWVSAIADAVGGVRFIARPLVLYRQHGNNACGASPTGGVGIALDLVAAAGSSVYTTGAALAQDYSETLQRLAASPEGERWKTRLEAGARRYRATHDYLLARAAFYETTRFPAKLGAWLAMSARWSYRFNPVRPSLFAFGKDFLAVFFRLA